MLSPFLARLLEKSVLVILANPSLSNTKPSASFIGNYILGKCLWALGSLGGAGHHGYVHCQGLNFFSKLYLCCFCAKPGHWEVGVGGGFESRILLLIPRLPHENSPHCPLKSPFPPRPTPHGTIGLCSLPGLYIFSLQNPPFLPFLSCVFTLCTGVKPSVGFISRYTFVGSTLLQCYQVWPQCSQRRLWTVHMLFFSSHSILDNSGYCQNSVNFCQSGMCVSLVSLCGFLYIFPISRKVKHFFICLLTNHSDVFSAYCLFVFCTHFPCVCFFQSFPYAFRRDLLECRMLIIW